FVAVSAGIADDLERTWRVPATRVTRIANPIDLARFAPGPRPTPDSLPRFLYVGRLHRSKGVDVLIEAWTRAGEPGSLTIVGDGPERVLLEEAAPPSVCFAGGVPDTAPWYRGADVFVLPSRREGLSNALLEAVASGLPVIATDVGETRAVLGGAGRVVPPGDIPALAAALAAPPPSPSPLESFAARYGAAQVATRHLDLYRELRDRRQTK
ncbi:MAG TPA: glycosyltransferase, partial [Acidimicrobiales bacterium]|nr:glycosyltransferase [Acidimicrobiales bacterium]